jgi:glycosyl transferase family 87
MAIARASQQRIGTDFHVFWQAGHDFAHGLPLYQRLEGARHFIYPPFAAQMFQILGLFPLKVAAALFYTLSVGLIVVAAWLCRDIGRKLEPTKPTRLPLILALLFSANFILNNLNMLQVNLLIFVLCLLGIRAFIEKREGAAGGWFVGATALKIIPIFFVIWTMIRGTGRSVLAALGFGALALTLPVIQRGPAQGIADLNDYYQSFLREFSTGRIVADYTNQNVGAMVYRALVPMTWEGSETYNYAYLPSLAGAAPLIYRGLVLGLLAVFLIHLIRLRILGRPIGALEIASVFLVSHLLSGITWKAHLVTLLFVFYVFFSLDRSRMSRVERMGLGLAWIGIGIIAVGRDIIGNRLHHYAGGYSVIVWVMLLLFMLTLIWSWRGPKKGVSGEETA